MTQDFAKIRPEPILERKTLESPPTWSLLLTGGLVGMTVGILACVLFYLSGRVPPLDVAKKSENATLDTPLNQDTEVLLSENTLDFEFYTELPKYVVPTDAVPVELNEAVLPREQNELLLNHVMLQTGAFQLISSAEQEMNRQIELGLKAVVKPAELPGRTLYLVQNGPYSSQEELNKSRELLKSYNINSLVVELQD